MQLPSCVYLRQVLYGCQNGPSDTEEFGAGSELRVKAVDEDQMNDDREENVDNADADDDKGGTIRRSRRFRGLKRRKRTGAREKEEEKKESAIMIRNLPLLLLIGEDLHHKKTCPLNTDLRNTKNTCKTSKCTDVIAAGEIRATSGQGKDVCEREGARCGA